MMVSYFRLKFQKPSRPVGLASSRRNSGLWAPLYDHCFDASGASVRELACCNRRFSHLLAIELVWEQEFNYSGSTKRSTFCISAFQKPLADNDQKSARSNPASSMTS